MKISFFSFADAFHHWSSAGAIIYSTLRSTVRRRLIRSRRRQSRPCSVFVGSRNLANNHGWLQVLYGEVQQQADRIFLMKGAARVATGPENPCVAANASFAARVHDVGPAQAVTTNTGQLIDPAARVSSVTRAKQNVVHAGIHSQLSRCPALTNLKPSKFRLKNISLGQRTRYILRMYKENNRTPATPRAASSVSATSSCCHLCYYDGYHRHRSPPPFPPPPHQTAGRTTACRPPPRTQAPCRPRGPPAMVLGTLAGTARAAARTRRTGAGRTRRRRARRTSPGRGTTSHGSPGGTA